MSSCEYEGLFAHTAIIQITKIGNPDILRNIDLTRARIDEIADRLKLQEEEGSRPTISFRQLKTYAVLSAEAHYQQGIVRLDTAAHRGIGRFTFDFWQEPIGQHKLVKAIALTYPETPEILGERTRYQGYYLASLRQPHLEKFKANIAT